MVHALIPKIDVVVENFAPGVMARAGLGYEELSAINPKLIMCSISLAGQTGPLSSKPGFDYMGAAYAGITSAIGEGDRGPAQLPIAIGDSATGVTAAMSVAFALLHRERTGEGQYIDCSLVTPISTCTKSICRNPRCAGLHSIPAHGIAASRWRPDRRVPL